APHVDHLLRFLSRIVVIIEFDVDARALRYTLVGVIGDIFGQRRIADRPVEAVALADAERAHGVIAAITAPAVLADTALAVILVGAKDVEQLLEEIAAALADHPRLRATAASEAGVFLQHGLALLRDGIAGADAAFQCLHVLAAAQDLSAQGLALRGEPAPGLGVVVAAV